MKRLTTILVLCLSSLFLQAQDNLVISEFMASNTKTLADEDGDFPDWIEVYNAGTNTVNLNGWMLGDRNNLWSFPATNLPPNSFLIVFASNKNRRIAGRPLHTNFRLDADPPEPVQLLRPDSSVAWRFDPPAQAPDYSYGIAVTETPLTLVTTGATGRLRVPTGDLGAWHALGFNDSAWTSVQNGVGFENGPAANTTVTLLANSLTEFSDTQGGNSWVYGYWDKRNDNDGIYSASTEFIPFPRGTGNTLNETNYWDGTAWNWPPPADPPFTTLNASGGRPAGANGSPTASIHWVVRRYISEANGTLRLSGILACSSQEGTCGDGVVGRIFVDGLEVFQRTTMGQSHGYSVLVNASVGSFIDFVIDAGAANNDLCDTTTFTATIRHANDTAIVADTVADWSDSGQQGHNSWTYGAFIRTNAGLAYSAARFGAFPNGSGPFSANNFWNGEEWQWFDGDPPFDRIGQFTAQPNNFPSTSTTNALEHWVIRRWVSEVAGTLHIDWHLAKKDLTGSGATARIFRNGTQISSMNVTNFDFVGSNRTETIANVQVGDLIDFAVDPNHPGDNTFNRHVGDICFFSATITASTTLSNHFRTDIASSMANINASAYFRIPFAVSNAAAVNTLSLRMKYDDGFNAYINGILVAGRNAPDPTAWNSSATNARVDAASAQFEEFDLTTISPLVLQSGNNVLAIQGLNSSASDGDFLIVAELKANVAEFDTTGANYFYQPTPGTPNSIGAANLGPIILDITHFPHEPAENEDLHVTARILPALHPVAANGVRLTYRVHFGAEVNLTMFDDGLHWDGAADDGVFGATIPSTAYGPGQMVRYYIRATDTLGSTLRQPPFPHALFSAQYFGAVVKNPALTNPLEVLHIFITDGNMNGANNNHNGRFPCSMYFLGEFYDNVSMNRHGQSSGGFPKRSYDIDFNSDHNFMWNRNEDRVDDINLLTTYPDKGHVRNIIGYETLRDAGAPHHFVVPVRVQTNGGFYGDWHMMENGDDNYLERVGRDRNGALYKMYNTFTAMVHTTPEGTPGSQDYAEKKTRRHEGHQDLVVLLTNLLSGSAAVRTNYMFDNINISASINTFAARTVTSEHDCCHKNYYFYRDSDGTGEWEAMAWDMDLSFGRNWHSTESYWDDRVYTNNSAFGNWLNNRFFQVVLDSGQGINITRQMYLRRLRTLMDEFQQTNGTPAELLYYEKRLDELEALIAPDAALDLPKWGSWGGGQINIFDTNNQYWRTMPQSIAETKTNYMVRRRNWVYNTRMGLGGADLTNFTNSQPTNVTILIGAIDYNPSSANQAEEYIQLVNTNRLAVDISHWQLHGAVEHTFQGGVVIPGGGSVYVVPDKNAFRNRATPPRRGMGLYVEGNYRGQLSARGETIILSNKFGIVRTNRYNGNPTPAQNQLRVTEIMYHPPVPAEGPFVAEDYEYIELRNIGSTTLNLAGIRFVNGIEFAFSGSLVTSLAPGAYVLIVKNIAAFETKYGPGFNIAGEYIGSLDNGGENLQIDDAVGEKVQDFSYNNSWYPITDGAGASLVIVDANAHWDSWGLKESWRPSTYDGGTPGAGDTPPIAVVPVLVNEVLNNTDAPALDAIELWNTNNVAADISGWFISDDFEEPKKFRIPAGTIIPAGGYILFDEDDFNPDRFSFPQAPTSFAFSSFGDEAYLFSGDGTNLTAYVHGFEFGAAETGVSFGRHVDSQTNEHFVASSANTLMDANAYPKVGPLVISEIMYHPSLDNSFEEFIELHNLSTNEVLFYDAAAPTNTWRLRGGVDFDFPTNKTLAAGAFTIVVSFNPTNVALVAQFRARYNLPAETALYGPYGGRLNNAGDSVRLLKPILDAGEVGYVLVDQLDYGDSEPWPLAADGIGASLQRKVLPDFGNDVINWVAGLSAGGTYGGTAPNITSESEDETTVAGRTVTLDVTVTGSEPIYYQWRRNSNNIPGATSASLVLPNIQQSQAGTYDVIVYNSAGSDQSRKIQLVVQLPPRINAHPLSQAVNLGGNVTFTVAASSVNTANLQYQWRFNGVNIPGATTASYTINNAQLSHDGFYTVTVTDPVDTVVSEPARLTILIQPAIVVQPATNIVAQGSTVVLSAAATNSATLPIGFRWRRNGGLVVSNSVEGYSDSFIISNVQGSNLYDVILYNLAQPSGRQSIRVPVVGVADVDGDGLPDYWENANDLDPGNPNDATADSDGDGMTNAEEFTAGTDPQDANSFLQVQVVSAADGPASVVLRFMAIANKTYTIQYRNALTAGNWTTLEDINWAPANRVLQITDTSPDAASRFYRLVTPKQ